MRELIRARILLSTGELDRALKLYDELSAEMLDLTLQNVAYDIVAITDSGMWGIIANNVPEFSTNIYKRLWDAKAANAQTKIDTLVEMYEELS